MGSSDNFCLRWNDFEANISTSFREVRQNSEFFDVTLCCDNGTDTVQAHKLILAACSPLFRHILAHNSHTNTFLYLKGIQLRELQAILNFMYHGEVNVAQESLNKFLAVAEELAVKGLTTNESLPTQAPPFYQQGEDAESTLQNKRILKKPKRNSVSTPIAAPKRKVETDTNDVTLEVDIKRIKEDPDGTAEPQDDTGEGELYESGEYEGLGQFDEDLADFDDSGAGASGATAGASGSENKEMEEATFLCSQKNRPVLMDKEGYLYNINRKMDTRIYWKCQCAVRMGCKGRALTEGPYITKRSGEHTHLPNHRGAAKKDPLS